MRISMLVFNAFLFPCYTLSAQQPIKDTARYLSKAFMNVTGERIKYETDAAHSNKYTITQFALKNCTIEATVKMKHIQDSSKNITIYTLTYKIPLKDLNEIDIVRPKDSTEYIKKGAVHFRMPYSSAAIDYKMVEDRTGRTEANGLYADADLWCKPGEFSRVINVLNALRKRCAPNKE